MFIPAAPATLPDANVLEGWDAAWSRLLTVPCDDGEHTFHVLDTGPALAAAGVTPTGTIVAVHGNPTWSYLWRALAAATLQAAHAVKNGTAAPQTPVWRLVAPDQLDMGFSDRLEHDGLPTPATAVENGPSTDRGYRTLTGRINDLDAIIRHLGLDEDARGGKPLLTLGHDWGGVISLGWATRNTELVSGIMTLNTAVHHPADQPIPAPLQAALAGPLLPGSTVQTPAFLKVTTGLGHPKLTPAVRAGFHLPYVTAERRGGIGGFVADIPVGPAHGSFTELNRLAEDIAAYGRSGKPALILWGPKDPVFLDRYLADLLNRLPQADLHRFEKAGHLLPEDADIATPILLWAHNLVTGTVASRTPAGTADAEPAQPLWAFLDKWRDSPATALVDMRGNNPETVSWAKLAAVVDALANGLVSRGVKAGDRVSLLVQPGRDLTAILYACLRIGAIGVVADAGLGIAGLTRAVRAARPQWIIGELPGLSVARAQNWPGRRISVNTLARPLAAALKVEDSVYGMIAEHHGQRYTGAAPAPADPAAILFTSGSTGPAKGTMYTHGRLANLTALLRQAFNVRPGSSLLAGFAPFALLGPAIGATSTTPDIEVTKPATLTAVKLAQAAHAAKATMVFASPAALRNVVATAHELSPDQRAELGTIELVLSAGAPVHPDLVGQVSRLFTGAEFHSPYGMTEALLLADIDGATIAAQRTAHQDGVCVGRPIGPVRIAIAPLRHDGTSAAELLEGTAATGVLGEVVISAPHMKSGYDRLWFTDARSRRDTLDGLEWHRTEDIGHLDADGRLWIEGRLQHVVTTANGPVAPGGPEARIDALEQVHRSAIVGVGPAGTQAVVAVIEAARLPGAKKPAPGLASTELAEAVRAAAAPVQLAAVLVTPTVPVDIRHQSKINRPQLAAWAERVLAGGKVGKP